MKTHHTRIRGSMDTIIPIGIYRYFDLTVFLKVAKFLLVKTKRQ